MLNSRLQSESATNKLILTGLAFSLALALIVSVEAKAEEETIGADEYRMSCLSCHGVGGKGDGPVAKYLNVKPADLTKLSKNSHSQYPDLKPGEFPFLKVYQMIDGRTDLTVHGDRAMPIWGDRYKADEGKSPAGYEGEYEKVVRGRILELVYYIQSIQEK
ncbi:c-type cytochrome [Hahella ganghwensis]|uniref:c-type cytochrome n=1 Tax=Hahella ganghwensis TaxID=286420 RepID=UPI00039B8791|nr:cytochrome c [Hahella ganghwensis]